MHRCARTQERQRLSQTTLVAYRTKCFNAAECVWEKETLSSSETVWGNELNESLCGAFDNWIRAQMRRGVTGEQNGPTRLTALGNGVFFAGKWNIRPLKKHTQKDVSTDPQRMSVQSERGAVFTDRATEIRQASVKRLQRSTDIHMHRRGL